MLLSLSSALEICHVVSDKSFIITIFFFFGWTALQRLLHCTALHCTVLYCTLLHCTVLYCTVLYCTVLYFTAQYSFLRLLSSLFCVSSLQWNGGCASDGPEGLYSKPKKGKKVDYISGTYNAFQDQRALYWTKLQYTTLYLTTH